MKQQRYATLTQYAQLCGVSRQAIHQRVQSGALQVKEINDVTGATIKVVDLKKFPPVKSPNGVRLK